MKALSITCYAVIFFLLFSMGYSQATDAEKASSEGFPMIAPIKSANKYENWTATPMIIEGRMMSEIWKWIKGGERQKPEGEIPVVSLNNDPGFYREMIEVANRAKEEIDAADTRH